MSRRIFIGLPASKEIQNKVLEFSGAHKSLPVRWTKPPNLHITLVPPWQAENFEVLPIIQKLKDIVVFEPFSLRFNQVSLGPSPHSPRLLWAIGPTTAEFTSLRNRLKKSIQESVNLIHGRDLYKLHMTLARIRSDIKLNLSSQAIDWTMLVDSFVLYESHLLPEGAEYEILQEFSLQIKNRTA